MFGLNFSFWTYYDNDVTPFIPELWANESIMILEENMVFGNLCYRDFDNVVAKYGETVHTRKPGELLAKRKTNADQITVQDVNANDVLVVLNQQLHTSFIIKDGEESKSFKDLVNEYMRPAMLAIARGIDLVCAGQVMQFMSNRAGGLNQLSSNNAKDFMLATRQVMNINKAYVQNRNLVLTAVSETEALRNDLFLQAQQVGDDGTALREASLGRKLGFDTFMDQNTPFVNGAGWTDVVGAVNNAAGYPAGTTVLTVDLLSAAITAGTWLTIAGDMTPLQVVSTVGGATPTQINVAAPGLLNAVVDDAVITLYPKGTVSNTYAAGYVKELAISPPSGVTPAAGMLVSFGIDTTNRYCIISYDSGTGILLDRPLVTGITSGDAINFGPPGSYNFAFHRNAFALVSRPLALPRAGTGAIAGVVNYNNMSMRVVITYDPHNQGHLVTLDTLIGVAPLDLNLGAVLFG